MDPSQLYREGKLAEAVEAQIQQVKAAPADQSKRLFLFELCAFAGDLERARRQIDAVNYGSPELDTATMAYRKNLDSEAYRRKVFEDGIMPQFLGQPPEHLGVRLQAIQSLRNKKFDEASKFIADADQACKPVRGMLNGKPFATLRDCDDLFGPTLEVFAHGDYYWLPLEQVDTLALNPPKFPRDLLWMSAKLSVKDGPAGDVFLPVLYPLTYQQADPQIKLGRATDWIQSEGGPVLGIGMRTFLVNDDPLHLPEWRELVMAES